MAVTAVGKRLLVGGEWIETGEWLGVRSPYSGEVVGRVAKGGAEETKRAIDAAEAAMRDPLPAHKRAEILSRVAGSLGRRHDEVARTICAEAGKPLKAARLEASRAMSTYTFAAVEARKLSGDVVPMDASQAGEGKVAFTVRRPIGVVGAISPFNFPLNLVAHKIAPALAADERVKAITFTGSSDVGWALRERAARKKVNLELGNATPVIVEADADLEEAASKLAANAFSFAGQSCISVQRIYVQGSALDAFLECFLPKVEALQVGDPADEETDVGPVIDDDARERILAWIGESGGEILLGGEATEEGLIRPTVIAGPPANAKVSCDEVFGPVCTVTPYETLDEAVALCNGTRFGLQAGIFTANVRTALRAAQELEFGGVTVNEAPTFRADQMPYGGVKASGNTREGPAYAVRELTEQKVVVINL